jgi:hypothetical protein
MTLHYFLSYTGSIPNPKKFRCKFAVASMGAPTPQKKSATSSLFMAIFVRDLTNNEGNKLQIFPSYPFSQKTPWRFSRNPGMKIMGRTTNFCGTKEKREKNERMISMGKKANAFFLPGSYFLFLLFS